MTYLPYLEDLEPLKQADVMFTDTSSIITEFIIQKKPVVTFNNKVPKDCFINLTTVDDLKSSIAYALKRPEDLMHKIEKFVLQEHPYFDGKSSNRVIDAVESFIRDNELNRLKSKPLNLIRKYKMCKKLNYFKF